MITLNICWDIDKQDIYEKLDDIPISEATKKLGLEIETYSTMSEEERQYYADKFLRSQWQKNAFMDLPDEVTIPNDISEDKVSDWLSNKYGFCHNGYDIYDVAE